MMEVDLLEVLISTGALLLLLVFFNLFTHRAPDGSSVMGALATSAIATYLVEALNGLVIGDIFKLEFFQEVGMSAGSLGGVIAAFLVALARKISPQNAAILAVAFAGIALIPGAFAAYLVSFVVIQLEKRMTNGLDFLVVVLGIVPLARYLSLLLTPLLDNSLLKIGVIVEAATESSGLLMGFLLGGIITVIGTSPLSSMALTAMLGLTGAPMGIASLSAFASSFMNPVILHRLKIGNIQSVVSIAIEPLSQADLISANPIPIYSINFIGGGLSGMIIAWSGMINNSPGTAAPVPGLLVMFGYNPWQQVVFYGLLCGLVSFIVGWIGTNLFKNYPITNSEVL